MELGVSLPGHAQDHEITQDQNDTQAELRAEPALGLRPTRHRAIFGLLHDTLPRDTNLRWSIAYIIVIMKQHSISPNDTLS